MSSDDGDERGMRDEEKKGKNWEEEIQAKQKWPKTRKKIWMKKKESLG